MTIFDSSSFKIYILTKVYRLQGNSLVDCWWVYKLVEPFLEELWKNISRALKISITFDLVALLLGLTTREQFKDILTKIYVR